MKKILLIVSVLLLPVFLTAQDDDIDMFPFEDEPMRDDSRTYFMLGGGVTYDLLMINEDNLNSFFPDMPEELSFSGPLHLTGGQGVVGIPWVENLRVGVFGYGGSLKTDIVEGNIAPQVKLFDQSTITTSMFGFSVHYGYVPFDHFAILGGLKAGWGDVTWECLRNQSNIMGDELFFGVSRLEKNFFFVMPNVQLEYAIANVVILRVDASYNLTIGQDTEWTYNGLNTSSVNSDFNLDGMKVGFGVMVGLANF